MSSMDEKAIVAIIKQQLLLSTMVMHKMGFGYSQS